MIGLKFYVPRGARDLAEAKEIESLLEEVTNTLNIDYEKFVIDEKMEQDLKSDVLLSLSVLNRIKIKQSRKAKSLYPQLAVFVNGKAVTFYPQERVKKGITVQEFLKGLLNGEVRCLHDKYAIEDELKNLK
jgi:autonomous glycyl radical cofactor GrcA